MDIRLKTDYLIESDTNGRIYICIRVNDEYRSIFLWNTPSRVECLEYSRLSAAIGGKKKNRESFDS